jgi:hypothetical protein
MKTKSLNFAKPFSTKSALGSRPSPNRNIKPEEALEGAT